MHERFYAPLKNLSRIIGLTISFSVFLSSPSRSQLNNIYSHASFAEKIYLQLDGKVYTTDKTIWFKAIVTDAIYHAPSLLSKVLYVELIGPDENIIEKKLIKIEDGVGVGFFDLNQSYSEGHYLIRAYTTWNKNFDADFFFKEYIQVFAATSKVKAEPIKNVTLVEKQKNERRLTAAFDPLAIDSLHKNELTLFITADNHKDSLSIKKNRDNQYLIDYALPDKCQLVTLKIQTKNEITSTKTIALNEDQLDLQFFPESGEIVHGLQSKVGFKALNYCGKGKKVEGEIVNSQGEVIALFKSNQLGMGNFNLARADSNTTYFARLKSPSDEKQSVIYPLPKVSPQGNILSVIKLKDKILIKASSSYLKSDSIYLRVSCRGMVRIDLKGALNEGELTFALPADQLPEGIIAFTLIDLAMQPVAERIYFNERPDSRINIAISADKKSYTQRELTKLNVETTNNKGEAVKANLSVLVMNKDQLGQIQSTRQNILSYFLLSSDLKGEIENPGFYFSKEENRNNHLDALLLTQGWRKYNYTKPVDKILFQPETTLEVSGTVSGVFSLSKKIAELTMMTFGQTHSVQTQTTDSEGRFNFNLNDEYGQNLNILIQSAKKSGVKTNYTITLDKKESPVISYNHIMSVERADSIVHTIIEKNIERKKMEDTYRLSSGSILLKEFVIEAYQMTPARKKVMEEYGKPDVVIDGKAIQEKEEKWSYGLYSVLMFNFPGKLKIVPTPNGGFYAYVSRKQATFVVIDGIPVKYYEYRSIHCIPPSEVKSFEIIENAKNFSKLYSQVVPGANPMNSYFRTGDVIAIYTYAGKGFYGTTTTIGMVKATVPVFSVSREFYAPKYENPESGDWFKPDLRALVHWEPKLATDSIGKASSTFYNADIAGKMQVVVEAFSEKGEIGYQEIVYDMTKKP